MVIRRYLLLAWLCLFALAFLGANKGSYNGGSYGSVGGYVGSKTGAGFWNGKDYVLVISTDDGFTGNVQWSALADSMGFPFTMALNAVDSLDQVAHLDPSEIVAIDAAGRADIVSTGLDHYLTWGILKWSEGALDTIATEIDYQWINNWTGISIAPTTYVTDIGPMSYEVAEVMRDSSGYVGARGIYHDNNAGGYKPDAPGADRWDKVRLYSKDDGGNIYGIASFRGQHDSDPTQAVFGTAAEANGTTIDSVRTRAERLLYDVSAASGNAPMPVVLHGYDVTNPMLSELIQYARERGDTWITDFSTLVSYARGKHVAIDAPPYAPFAQLEGIDAADQMFFGPAVSAAAATDSFIFHNSNTSAPETGKTVDTTGPFASGFINPAAPTVVGTLTGNLDAAVGTMPIAGSYKSAMIAFNVDALDGKTVTYARLHYNGALGTDVSGVETSYFGVVGVTNTDVLAASGESDMSYNYVDVSTTTAWAFGDIGDLDFLTDFGPFIYADNDLSNMSNSFVSQDVTEYLQAVVDGDLAAAMFMLYGNDETPTTLYRVRVHENTDATRRPYLIVYTHD